MNTESEQAENKVQPPVAKLLDLTSFLFSVINLISYYETCLPYVSIQCVDEPGSCSEDPLSEDDGGTAALLRPSNVQEDSREKRENSDEPPAPPTTYQCGCGPWQPRWLQRIVSAKLFTVLLCTYSLIEGTIVSGEGSIYMHTT